MENKILVTGASGLIGHHLLRYLKNKGYWVRGADIRKPEYTKVEDYDEFIITDLREYDNCLDVTHGINEVYQLAAQMGGMGYISVEHLAAHHDSNLINTYMPRACIENGVEKVFFSSSACVYPTVRQNSLEKIFLTEEDAYPAYPNEEYGWEKLMAERRYLTYAEKYNLKVRIARFGNCYGEEAVFDGGREKAPAALCRKVAKAKDGEEIEVWGDGKATRSFMYVEDCVKGVFQLMQSDCDMPVNLGSEEIVSINELAELIILISGKKLSIKHVSGPQGVRGRYIDHSLANIVINWKAETKLKDGMEKLYKWIYNTIN